MRFRVVRVSPEHFAEFALRPGRIARRNQRARHPVAQRRIVWGDAEPLAECGDRAGPVLRPQRLHAGRFVRHRAVEYHLCRFHQRIGHHRCHVAATQQQRLRLVCGADVAVCHRERIVHDRRPWIRPQRLLEIRHRLAVGATRQRGAAGTEQRRRRVRALRDRRAERGLRLVIATEVELHLTQPDQRGHVRWFELRGARERHRGPLPIARSERRVSEQVGPPRLVGYQRRGLSIAEPRVVEECGRQQHVAELAVACGAFFERCRWICQCGAKHRLTRPQLRAHRSRHVRQIGKRDRHQRLVGSWHDCRGCHRTGRGVRGCSR